MLTLIITGLIVCGAIPLLILLYYVLARSLFHSLPLPVAPSLWVYLILSLAFVLTGYNIGVFTGLSITPVIQYVVPAVLTFVTGFIAYLFVKKDDGHKTAYQAAWIVLAFNIGLFTGGAVGMMERGNYERDAGNQELRKQLFLKRLEYYTKYRIDTGIQNIRPPYEDTIRKDSVKIAQDKVPPFTRH